MTRLNPTERFSDRVADYIKYRPDYPQALFVHLRERHDLATPQTIADIGSGTGILTQHLLDYGHRVYGVEPNLNMRLAAEHLLQAYPRFISVDGQAEATTLADNSVDWVVASQAFHWFDPEKTPQEFERILTPEGQVALIWNDRLESDPFHQAYEQFLQTYCEDYQYVNHRRLKPENLAQIFALRPMTMTLFENAQIFDFDGLKGRLLSCSYAPKAEAPDYEIMLIALRHLFERYSQQGQLIFHYKTKLYHFGPSLAPSTAARVF